MLNRERRRAWWMRSGRCAEKRCGSWWMLARRTCAMQRGMDAHMVRTRDMAFHWLVGSAGRRRLSSWLQAQRSRATGRLLASTLLVISAPLCDRVLLRTWASSCPVTLSFAVALSQAVASSRAGAVSCTGALWWAGTLSCACPLSLFCLFRSGYRAQSQSLRFIVVISASPHNTLCSSFRPLLRLPSFIAPIVLIAYIFCTVHIACISNRAMAPKPS